MKRVSTLAAGARRPQQWDDVFWDVFRQCVTDDDYWLSISEIGVLSRLIGQSVQVFIVGAGNIAMPAYDYRAHASCVRTGCPVLSCKNNISIIDSVAHMRPGQRNVCFIGGMSGFGKLA